MDTLIPTTRRPYKQRTDGMPNKLRWYRLNAGLSLPRLSKTIGVTVQALREAEVSGTGIGKDKWYRLADIFDVDPRILESP